MTALSIRKATDADLPALLTLYGQPSFNNGRVISLNAAKAIFARMALYPDFAAYLAEIDGAVVGTFSLMLIDNIAHWGTPTALVENVVVAEDRQGGGIGREMMRAAFARAEAKGAYKVALSSGLKKLAAHAFYESLGYEKYGYSFRLDQETRTLAEKPSSLEGEGWDGDPTLRECAAKDHPVASAGYPLSTSPPGGGRGQAESATNGEASS